MNIKSAIKQGVKLVFGKRPIQLSANIVQLAPSELLKGRAALITGGTSGIGFSIAEAMLDAGIGAVVITGRTEKRCQDAVSKLLLSSESRTGRVYYQVMDNRNPGTFKSDLVNIVELLGGG